MFGVYFEYDFPAQEVVTAFLYIPEYADTTKNGEVVPATLMFRGVSVETPQKSYKFLAGSPTGVVSVGSYGDPTTLALQLAPQLALFDQGPVMSVESNPEFALNRDPIYIEINQPELQSIVDRVAPRSLLSRIYRARTASGYPALPGKE